VKYRCKEAFSLDKYDDDGACTGECIDIEKGDAFELSEDAYRLIGGKETVRLDNDSTWLEVTEETLHKYFEEQPK
jgi:hypothetical protein